MFGLRKRVKKLEEVTKNLCWCCECGEPHRRRTQERLYPTGGAIGFTAARYRIIDGEVLAVVHAEIPHCKNCDPIVEQRKKAEEIAKRCPDEVVKLANRKACEAEQVRNKHRS